MIPFGVTWTTFLQLYGALAGVVVLIFVLRAARRGRAISSTLIWEKVTSTRQSIWRELLSLFLQLLILLLICLALVDPQTPAEDIQRRWVGLIFDSSESMAAREGDASRLRLAERDAWGLISSLAEVDRAMVVSAGAEVRSLTPFTDDQEELKDALTQLKAHGTRPKIEEAITYTLSSFDYAKPGPQDLKLLYVFTDRPDRVQLPELPEIETQLISVGSSLPNLAVGSFDVRKAMNLTETHEALITVHNHAQTDVSARLTLFTPEEQVGTKAIQLAAGGAFSEVVALPFGTSGKVTAVLRNIAFASGEEDALASDDAAFAFVQPVQPANVVLVTEKNLFLHNVLALNPEINLVAVKPAEYQHALSTQADVVVFDRFSPAMIPACSAVYFYPSSQGPFAIAETKKKPAMTSWAEGHPLLRHVRMDTLMIESSRLLIPREKDVVLMGHYEQALILLRPNEDNFLLGIGFDLAKTDLPLQSAFPIFMHNVIHVFARRPSEEPVTSYRLGERVELYVTPGRPRVLLVDPLQNQIKVPVRGGLGVFRPTVPGFHAYADGEATRIFAASLLDEDESNLTVQAASELTPFPINPKDNIPTVPRPWLVLAALALVAFDMVLFLNGKLS